MRSCRDGVSLAGIGSPPSLRQQSCQTSRNPYREHTGGSRNPQPESLVSSGNYWDTARMAGTPKEQGPTSARVAANLRRIRQEHGGISYAELSRRLEAAGHPILDTGLMKIEKGRRRVDVDDLMALAVALGVTPSALLMPRLDLAAASRAHELTPGVSGTSPELWAWASGEVPLGHAPASADA